MLGLSCGTRGLRWQCVLLVPWPGIHRSPLRWELGVLATGPPGMSPLGSLDVPQPKSWTVELVMPRKCFIRDEGKGKKGQWLTCVNDPQRTVWEPLGSSVSPWVTGHSHRSGAGVHSLPPPCRLCSPQVCRVAGLSCPVARYFPGGWALGWLKESERASCSVVPSSSQPRGLQPARLLCPRDFPGENPAVGCHCRMAETSNFCPWASPS